MPDGTDDSGVGQLEGAVKGMFNGDNIKQALSNAWDRMTGGDKSVSPTSKDEYIQMVNKHLNDSAVDRANKSFQEPQTKLSSPASPLGKTRQLGGRKLAPRARISVNDATKRIGKQP